MKPESVQLLGCRCFEEARSRMGRQVREIASM